MEENVERLERSSRSRHRAARFGMVAGFGYFFGGLAGAGSVGVGIYELMNRNYVAGAILVVAGPVASVYCLDKADDSFDWAYNSYDRAQAIDDKIAVQLMAVNEASPQELELSS